METGSVSGVRSGEVGQLPWYEAPRTIRPCVIEQCCCGFRLQWERLFSAERLRRRVLTTARRGLWCIRTRTRTGGSRILISTRIIRRLPGVVGPTPPARRPAIVRWCGTTTIAVGPATRTVRPANWRRTARLPRSPRFSPSMSRQWWSLRSLRRPPRACGMCVFRRRSARRISSDSKRSSCGSRPGRLARSCCRMRAAALIRGHRSETPLASKFIPVGGGARRRRGRACRLPALSTPAARPVGAFVHVAGADAGERRRAVLRRSTFSELGRRRRGV